jgi:hypothetical protein
MYRRLRAFGSSVPTSSNPMLSLKISPYNCRLKSKIHALMNTTEKANRIPTSL